MGITLDNTILSLSVSFFLAWTGFLIGAVRWLLDRSQAHLDKRFRDLEEALLRNTTEWQRVERDLLELKALLPTAYVAREDWIRSMGVFDRKVDLFFDRFSHLSGVK